jgi:hypothetical protein
MQTPDFRRIAVVMALSAVLGACGSSGGDDAPTTGGGGGGTGSDAPARTFDSVASLVSYVNELIAGTSETSEPVRVTDAALPVSDTTEPAN